MQGRKFSRKFKLEAPKLVRERGVSVSQAARDLDLHENVSRKWVREQTADPGSAFPGHGVLKPEQQEIERLCRELARMKPNTPTLDAGPILAPRASSGKRMQPNFVSVGPAAAQSTMTKPQSARTF